MHHHHRFHRRAALGLVLVLATAACSSDDVASPATESPSSTATPSTTVAVTTTQASTTTQGPTATRPGSVADAWIVYQGAKAMQRVLPDGTGLSFALKPTKGKVLHPDFSRDGESLAFIAEDDDGTRDIWVSGWDGSDPKELYDCLPPCIDADGAAWSPDSTQLAFVQVDIVDGRSPGSVLKLVDVASGAVTEVFRTEGAEYMTGPRWSPDGSSVVVEVTRYANDAVTTEELTGRAIAIIHLDRTPVAMDVIRDYDTFSSYPDWHPTEDLLLFHQGGKLPLDTSEPAQNVFTMRPDGSDVRAVTTQGPDENGYWMATFRTDGDGFLANRVDHETGDLTLVAISLDGTVTDLRSPPGLFGAHPRQRWPQG